MALFSHAQMETLALLFAHPKEEFHLSQIGKILGKHPGVFQRGINALEREGVLGSRKNGNLRLFSVNEGYPLLSEVRSIVNKTHGAEGMLREFADERTDIAIAFIYGSYAKNTMNAASDIDLLLIITHKEIEDDLISGLSLIEEKLQREINYKIYTSTEFKRKRRNEDPFLSEIMSSDYIMLKGKI